MGDVIAEFLLVLEYSTRTKVALVLALLFFFGFQLMGQFFVGRLELHGVLAPMTEAVRDQIMGRYDKAAWLSLGSLLWAAGKCYRKDRHRLFNL